MSALCKSSMLVLGVLLGVALPVALGGCGEPAPSDPDHGPIVDYDGPVMLELGEGTTAFDLRTDGSQMTLRRGIQGGHHLDVAFRFHGVSANELTISVDAARASDDMPVAATLFRELSEGRVQFEHDHFVRFGDQLRLLADFGPDALDGESVRITVTMTPGSGAPVAVSTSVVIEASS